MGVIIQFPKGKILNKYLGVCVDLNLYKKTQTSEASPKF